MLSETDLEKVCKLSKLQIVEIERKLFLGKLNQVFNWIEQLSKIDVSKVDINDTQGMKDTPERVDEPCMQNNRESLLSNTKYKKFDMFCVPKVVE
ncbi:MAG: Asp-tRNA(Asn)/Glu-tRNA(Gln) amidotransferase subunit GatC [Alphaproteobacteria bacterium]|nr:Asp-tRNA(Asn)/Glu-tRNA(Gln) amidotransferase subunit GatC [Alphaproteobacteria bacterium]